MKILVAEDALVSRRLLQKVFEEWGHEVFAVENGGEAWEILQKENIKFVIADWMMPEMDGITLCKKIRSTESLGYIYFILLTSKDRKEDLIEGLGAEIDDYVIKPFEREELRGRVRTGERILKLEKELIDKNEKLVNLNIKLEHLACIDPLMDIGNRRRFYEMMQKMHHRACRYDYIYSLIMCDIDNFKAYNDTYGHLEGDNVLKKVANTLKSSIRKSDELYRYGGEEIVIILPAQNLEATFIAAERCRKDIEALCIEHKSSDKGILTMSCGISAFDKECEDTKWESVLDRADKALYKAKAAGKNQTCS